MDIKRRLVALAVSFAFFLPVYYMLKVWADLPFIQILAISVGFVLWTFAAEQADEWAKKERKVDGSVQG